MYGEYGRGRFWATKQNYNAVNGGYRNYSSGWRILRRDASSAVKGFLCEADALVGALEITAHGGWRGYRSSLVP